MQLADIALTQQAFGAPADERLFVKFEKRAVENPLKSTEAGRKICDMVDFVIIARPGDSTTVIHRQATREDRQRFHRQWQAFEANQNQDAASGTPLEVLVHTVPPILNLAQVEELKYFKITTAENLANLSDDVAGKFMGGQALKQKAKAFIDATKASAPTQKLQADLEKANATIEAQADQIEAQADQIKKLSDKIEHLVEKVSKSK